MIINSGVIINVRRESFKRFIKVYTNGKKMENTQQKRVYETRKKY